MTTATIEKNIFFRDPLAFSLYIAYQKNIIPVNFTKHQLKTLLQCGRPRARKVIRILTELDILKRRQYGYEFRREQKISVSPDETLIKEPLKNEKSIFDTRLEHGLTERTPETERTNNNEIEYNNASLSLVASINSTPAQILKLYISQKTNIESISELRQHIASLGLSQKNRNALFSILNYNTSEYCISAIQFFLDQFQFQKATKKGVHVGYFWKAITNSLIDEHYIEYLSKCQKEKEKAEKEKEKTRIEQEKRRKQEKENIEAEKTKEKYNQIDGWLSSHPDEHKKLKKEAEKNKGKIIRSNLELIFWIFENKKEYLEEFQKEKEKAKKKA